MQKIQNYINGKYTPPISGAYFDNVNPSLGLKYSSIPDSDNQDIQSAVDAASEAFPGWSQLNSEKRSRIMLKIADLIDQNLEKFALAETIDNGKPISLSRKIDIPRASANFRFFATAILHFASESHLMDGVAINYTTRTPIGVVGCISPWNLPLYLYSWKIAPALAAGNTVVSKPSEITPMTAYLLGEICTEAGLPPGVLNIIQGKGNKAGQAIVEHPDIKAISFTGGTVTGQKIAVTAGPMFKKLSLELGEKNPNIIFEDCDFEETLTHTIRSSFSNQGQICLCGSRIFIQKSIYSKFKKAFIERSNRLKIGDPIQKDTEIGAIVSAPHMQKILSCIELAKKEGGTILTGGEQMKLDGDCSKGIFY